jgi:hypothetical protein
MGSLSEIGIYLQWAWMYSCGKRPEGIGVFWSLCMRLMFGEVMKITTNKWRLGEIEGLP